MLTLALDTSARDGSLALLGDGRHLGSATGDGALTHAERLPAAIEAIVAAHGLGVRDIDLFAVAAGPGSFTGLRIGIATIQGLAFATDRPVVAVSTLDALALIALEAITPASIRGDPLSPVFVAASVDAHRQQIFAALWTTISRAEPAGAAPESGDPLAGLAVVEPPTVDRPAAICARWAPLVAGRSLSLAGDGALAFSADAVGLLPHFQIVRPLPPLAPAIARLAASRAANGLAGPPHAVRPLYVRRPDAELARDQKKPQATIPGGKSTVSRPDAPARS